MYYSINRNIVVLVTALFSLFFLTWNSSANGNPKQNGFASYVYYQSILQTGNYFQNQKANKICSIKIPVSRRKYFRDERTVAIVDFNNDYSKFELVSSNIRLVNTGHFYKVFLSHSLLRGPPIV